MQDDASDERTRMRAKQTSGMVVQKRESREARGDGMRHPKMNLVSSNVYRSFKRGERHTQSLVKETPKRVTKDAARAT